VTNYDIPNESTLHVHLVLRLLGMITAFTANNTNDPLMIFFMLSDEARTSAVTPTQAL